MHQESDRLDRLETGLRKTQDSILLMGKDLHTLTQTMQSIANSMDALVALQQDVKLAEQRNETEHEQLRLADKKLHTRIDLVEEKLKDLEVVSFFSKHIYLTTATFVGIGVMFIKEVRDYFIGLGG